MDINRIAFGDNVLVRTTPATEKAGIAGRKGQVYGETTPSVTGVEVIGETLGDYALNVQLEEDDETYWLTPSELELIDHAPGMEIRLDGVATKWVRQSDGSWDQHPDGGVLKTARPWWKFW